MTNEYEVRGEVTAIFLRRRDGSVFETLIDTADLPLAQSIAGRWYGMDNGSSGTLYCYVSKSANSGEALYLHRLLTGSPSGKVVDHINHDGLDNRRGNLRVVDNAANMQNRRGPQRNSRTGVLGVHPDKSTGKFTAEVMRSGKRFRCGYFDTVPEAESAVVAARRAVDAALPIAA